MAAASVAQATAAGQLPNAIASLAVEGEGPAVGEVA